MSEGKDRYEERRLLENENAVLREQKNNRRLKVEAELEDGTMVIVRGLRDLFDGKSFLSVEPGNVGWIISVRRNP